MAKNNNNKPYNNRNYNNRNYNNRTNKKNSVNRYNNSSKKNNDLDTTTRIRIDEERINDSESLDTSFLEGRTNKKVDTNKKLKQKILKDRNLKQSKPHFKLLKNLFYGLGCLCIVVLILLIFLYDDKDTDKVTKKKENTGVIQGEAVKEKEVIDKNYLFIGDFNTNNFDFKKFNLDYHYVKVSEDDYKTDDILNDMKSKVYDYNPSDIFIELGINDLNEDVSKEEIINNLETIIKDIKKNRPYAEIYIESIYPIDKNVDDYEDELIDKDIDNEDIIELNKLIKEMVLKNKVNYLDLYEELSEDNKLKEDYTHDGVHLSEDGYKRVLKTINRVLDDEK